jgi:membrane protease subunit HflK
MEFKIPDTPEELFRQARPEFKKINKWLPIIVIIFVLISIALTSFYTVEADEVGVITRFGRYVKTTKPGLHWKFPFQIDKLYRVKVKKIFKDEFGFRTEKAGINTKYSTGNFDGESIMLTGDLNVLDVTWIVQFRVKDPVKFLFRIRSPRETVRDLSEAIMRQVIGDSTVSEALSNRRININQEVQDRLQVILDAYESGIHVETVKLQDVNPPKQVRPSFNEVNEAKQEREKVINQSWEAYNKVIPRARGQAEKVISQAKGYALSRVKRAQGDAAKFVETWQAYKEAKTVTKRRLYLETLGSILPATGKMFIFDPSASQAIPLLNLNEGVK